MVRRIVALTVLFASSCGIAVAQSIAIDQSFGEQGIVRFPTSVSYDTIRYVQAISTLRDGSLAIVTSDLQDQFFSRLTYDGRFDARFGVNGTVRVPRTQFIEKVIDDSSDRLVTAGGYVDELRVARFNPDGRLDASFGTGGVATFRISTGGRPSARD